MHRFGIPSERPKGHPGCMTTERHPSVGAEVGVDRAVATILTVLQLLDEQWDTVDDHSKRVTVRLAVERAREQWRRIERERPVPD